MPTFSEVTQAQMAAFWHEDIGGKYDEHIVLAMRHLLHSNVFVAVIAPVEEWDNVRMLFRHMKNPTAPVFSPRFILYAPQTNPTAVAVSFAERFSAVGVRNLSDVIMFGFEPAAVQWATYMGMRHHPLENGEALSRYCDSFVDYSWERIPEDAIEAVTPSVEPVLT